MITDNVTGKELLWEYREYDVGSFLLREKLVNEITDFFNRLIDTPVVLDVFLNDSGKYIVVVNYSNRGEITENMVNEFCKEYGVRLDHITTEVLSNYEGFEMEGNVTYLFEIIK